MGMADHMYLEVAPPPPPPPPSPSQATPLPFRPPSYSLPTPPLFATTNAVLCVTPPLSATTPSFFPENHTTCYVVLWMEADGAALNVQRYTSSILIKTVTQGLLVTNFMVILRINQATKISSFCVIAAVLVANFLADATDLALELSKGCIFISGAVFTHEL